MGVTSVILWLHAKTCRPWMVPALWTVVGVGEVLRVLRWLTF